VDARRIKEKDDWSPVDARRIKEKDDWSPVDARVKNKHFFLYL
jgi:hypothetical protein